MDAQAPPLEVAIPWAEQRLRARVLHVRPLVGATSSDLYRLRLDGDKTAILRLFTGRAWLTVEPDLAEHEAAALVAVESLPFGTPRLLAFDPDGRDAGVPAVLMSEVPGRIDLLPRNLHAWLAALAEPLTYLGVLVPPGFQWTYRTWQDLDRLEVPAWSARADLWADVFDAVRAGAPASTKGLIHRDYHPTNVLWQQGRVCGVVDWVNACIGPTPVDVAHCRLNLAAMYGPEVAELFTEKVEAATALPHNRYWDLLNVVEWLPEPDAYEPWDEFGLPGIDTTLMRERVEEFAARAVRQLV